MYSWVMQEVISYLEANLMDELSMGEYVRKWLKLSAFLKTKDVSSAGIWMRVDDGKGDMIQFDNMQNRPVTGSTECNQYVIVLDIPSHSESIHFGVLPDVPMNLQFEIEKTV